MLRKHKLQALAIRKRTPQVLQSRGLDAPISKWELTDTGDLVLLFGTLSVNRLDKLERYSTDRVLHHLSTVCDGLPCLAVNTNGLRYAFVLHHEPQRLPKAVDFPGCERGQVRLGQDAEGNEAITDWQSLGHLLVAGMTGSGKSNLLRLLAHQAINSEAMLLLADIDARTFPMLADHPALMEPIATDPEAVHDLIARGLAECDRRSVVYGTVSGHPDKLEDYNAQAVREDAETLPRVLILLDEFNATALSLGGANGDFCGDVAKLAWRGRKFGINLVVAAQDFAKAIIGRMRDQVTPLLFKVRSDALARRVGCERAADIPKGRPGLAITQRWGPVQTYYLPKATLGAGQPDILSDTELDLVLWSLRDNDGYLGLSEIQEHGGMGQGPARRLGSEWERRGWLAKDPQAGNKRKITADFEQLIYKLKSPQSPKTRGNDAQTGLQSDFEPSTSPQPPEKPGVTVSEPEMDKEAVESPRACPVTGCPKNTGGIGFCDYAQRGRQCGDPLWRDKWQEQMDNGGENDVR